MRRHRCPSLSHLEQRCFMKEDNNSKGQLTKMLENARQQINKLKDSVSQCKQTNKTLKESGQIFRAIFENASDGILLADIESKKFFMGNKQICKALGYGPEELINIGVKDIHPEKDLPYVLDQFEKLIQNEIMVAKDIPVKKSDGSIYYVDVGAFPITLRDKTYMVGIFRDITDRKRVENELRESEKRYRQLIEQAGDGIFLLDKEGRFDLANSKVSEMLGYTEDELHRLNIIDTYPDELKDIGRKRLASIQSGKSLMFERPMKRKDGSVFLAEANTTRIEDGRTQGIIHDITERKQVEEALKKSEERYRTIF
ncbi:MAG TPA: PAS domain-containing protein, partial [Desulfomonilia bacterium]|nr:PAS domain-containing protein [Desulfomonilia bacterium]